MKKILTVLITVAMILTFVAGFAVTSSAAPEFLEKEYDYSDAVEEFGNEETKTNPVFCGGLWMYEYYHEVDETFGTMEAWFDKTPEGVGSSVMTNFYTAIENSYEEYKMGPGTLDDYYFCAVRYNGKGMHPGINVAAVITFVCPADGKISYTVKGCPTGTGNVPEKNSTGNHLYVFQDETVVYEVEEAFYNEDKSTYDVDLILDVKEGQKIRYVVGANGSRGSKGWDLKEMPCVTYLESSVPIGDPAGNAPTGLTFPERTDTTATLSWDPLDDVDGYNVYMGDEKLNSELITDASFKIEGLEPGKAYEDITVTSVKGDVESGKSDPKSVRTRKAEDGDAAGKSTDAPAAQDSASAATNNPSGNEGGKMEAWVIVLIVAGIVLLVLIAVVMNMMKKMKQLSANNNNNENKND